MSQNNLSFSEIPGIGNLYPSSVHWDIGPTSQGRQPLAILFTWVGASEKAVRNYVNLYTEKGVDCLVISGYMSYFLRPLVGMEVAERILNYLIYKQKRYESFFVHSFSIGAFMVNLIAIHIRDNAEQFGPFQARLLAVVMDSVTVGSLENMAEGVAKSISDYSLVRWIALNIVMLYFRMSPWTVQFYEDIVAHIFSAPFDVPALFYCSVNDPMCNFTELGKLTTNWTKKLSNPVVVKSWEKSVHTAHIRFHREEYIHAFEEFCRLVPNFFPSNSNVTSKM